jgi:hypothetical protein
MISVALADASERPDWTDLTSRHVVGGDVLQVGQGVGRSAELARFKAEAMAVRNIISECSLPHREIVIWDRYSETGDEGNFVAWARAGISFLACEEARKAKGTERVKLANPALISNQDLYSELEGLSPEASIWDRVRGRVYELFGIQNRRISDAERKVMALESKVKQIEQAPW